MSRQMKKATVTIVAYYDPETPDEWIEFAAGDAYVQMHEAVFRDANTDEEVEFFSSGTTTQVTITTVDEDEADIGTHITGPRSDLARATTDDHKHLSELRGTFADGYDDEAINDALEPLTAAEMVCAWARNDDGYTGDSELIGRVGDGPWRRIHPDLWAWLLGDDAAPETLPTDTLLLSDDLYEDQQVANWTHRSGANTAPSTDWHPTSTKQARNETTMTAQTIAHGQVWQARDKRGTGRRVTVLTERTIHGHDGNPFVLVKGTRHSTLRAHTLRTRYRLVKSPGLDHVHTWKTDPRRPDLVFVCACKAVTDDPANPPAPKERP